jgi:small GTP-binding protein
MKKKCVFIGEQGTGKTCILKRIINDEYVENPETTNSPSNTFFQHDYNGITEKLEFWDTAGQEIYRAVNKLFYKGAHICFLVYSIDNGKSFNELKKYWVPTIHTNIGSEVSFCFVVSKADLFDTKETITESEGKNFADEIGGSFILTSAKLGIGFPQILEAGLDAYYQKHPDERNDQKNGTVHINEITRKKSGCC